MNSVWVRAKMSCQIFHCSSYAVMDVKGLPTLVDTLLLRCSPSAVRWFVVTIAFDAVNRVLRRRTRTHVGVEVLERFEPTRADGDTSSAVKMELLSARQGASLADIAPHPKLRRRGQAVSDGALTQLLDAQTAARVRAFQVVRLHQRLIAAVTATAILRVLGIFLRLAVFENRETSEPLAQFDGRAFWWHLNTILQAKA